MPADTTDQSTPVVRSVFVGAPPSRAFEIFTAGVGRWWPKAHHLGSGDLVEVVIEPRLGGRWYERTTDGAECDWGQVLAWEPPAHLSLSWHLLPSWDGVDPRQSSVIEVTFEATGDGTQVTLEHTGIERHGPQWRQIHDGVAGAQGWAWILEGFAAACGPA
jgi:uncharacterized protein YndB with AHSA1/START domain